VLLPCLVRLFSQRDASPAPFRFADRPPEPVRTRAAPPVRNPERPWEAPARQSRLFLVIEWTACLGIRVANWRDVHALSPARPRCLPGKWVYSAG